MTHILTLEEADALVDKDSTKYWWDTYAKTLVLYTPTRAGSHWFKKDAVYNRRWRGRNRWGTVRRIEVNEQGLFEIRGRV